MIFEKIRERLKKARNQVKDNCEFRSQTKCNNYSECSVCIVDYAIDIINQVEAEYNNGWIPCSERLPEDGQCVVVQVKDHYALEDGVPIQIRKFDTRYEGHNWKEIGDGRWIANHCVIAWQPLPEPYTPKGE